MDSIQEIKNKVLPIVNKYGVKRIALFGSYARGEQTESSDIDFVIDKGQIHGIFQFYGFVGDLEEALGAHVDVLSYAQLPNTMFMEDVLNDEVVLYE
jgi:predicted nucleotidyltransferase